MPGKLSTHVLDTANGRPAANMQVQLFEINGESAQLIRTVRTNQDGRNPDGPLLDAENIKAGTFELRFHVGEYFRGQPNAPPPPENGIPFLDVVPVRFGITDHTQGYHVPLLCSQWSSSTYRGS